MNPPPSEHRPSIYETVAFGHGDETADRFRYLISDEATNDREWRALYDEVLDAGGPMPEMMRQNGRPLHKPGMAFVAFGEAPSQRVAPIWARVTELGETAVMPDMVDVVAAVGAAEIWLSAIGSLNFSSAASMGCDAISSLAAIMARSIGRGTEIRPGSLQLVDGPAVYVYVRKACEAVRVWSNNHLGADLWPLVKAMIVADLSWQACGGSLTWHAASIASTS